VNINSGFFKEKFSFYQSPKHYKQILIFPFIIILTFFWFTPVLCSDNDTGSASDTSITDSSDINVNTDTRTPPNQPMTPTPNLPKPKITVICWHQHLLRTNHCGFWNVYASMPARWQVTVRSKQVCTLEQLLTPIRWIYLPEQIA